MTLTLIPLYPLPPPPLEIEVSVVGYVSKAAFNEVARSMEQIEPATDASPAGTAPGTRMQLAAVLDRYVRDAAPGEDRVTARQRVEAAMHEGKRDATLDLKDLGLLKLPPILPTVENMDFSGNRLSTLPPLPCEVKVLLVSRNRLVTLPNVLSAQLIRLDVSKNHLSELPETLPNSLQHLDARDNGLRNLPARLPNALRVLYVEHNRADLMQIAADRVRWMTGRRVVNHTLGAGVTTAKVIELADGRRCYQALDRYRLAIEFEKVRSAVPKRDRTAAGA